MNDYCVGCQMLKTRCNKHQTEEKRLKEEIDGLKKELSGFHAICDEYLEGTETTRNPEFLGSYLEEKDEEIDLLKEQIDEKDEEIKELEEKGEEIESLEISVAKRDNTIEDLKRKVTWAKKIKVGLEKEVEELEEEIYEFNPLTGGLDRGTKKLDVANKKLMDFYETMTEDQQKDLIAYKGCVDGSPIDHQDAISWMAKLLQEREEFEEENNELHVEFEAKDDEIKKLKEKIAEIPSLLEEERYKEREELERDYADLDDELKEENEDLKEENEKLKEKLEIELAYGSGMTGLRARHKKKEEKLKEEIENLKEKITL